MTLTERDFPALYQAADRESVSAQKGFLRASAIELTFAVVAAFSGAFVWKIGGADWAGVLAACAFTTALFSRIYILTVRPDRTWYDGRAVAESAKHLSWRYMVGAEPFRADIGSEKEASDLFVDRLDELLKGLKGLHLVPPTGAEAQITNAMKHVRALPLQDRKDRYRAGRLEDQRSWYAGKARWNRRRAKGWNIILLCIEGIGLAMAVFKAASILNVDFLGLAAAVVAAGMSWLQVKQHNSLAEAYSVAAHELGNILEREPHSDTEEDWSDFVNQAEDAISREHTLWKASRTSAF